MIKLFILIALLLFSALKSCGQYVQELFNKGHAISPERRNFSEELMNQLQLPDGFKINVFAKDLNNPRMMRLGTDGIVYVTVPDDGKVFALKDDDNNGTAENKTVVASGLSNVHGIEIRDNKVYLCAPKKLWSANILNDGNFSEPHLILDNLPEGGRHENRTLHFGPDNKFYISVGSSCNACNEDNNEHAAILQMNPDGSGRKVFVKGLRNTIGFGWHPETKKMWGMDHGSDWRGDDIPPEELNKLEEGKDYGWPYCYGKNIIDELMDSPPNMSKEEYSKNTTGSTLDYQAHSAPIEMIFYTGEMFPSDYNGDAFVAMRGSWNRKPPTGYKVVRIHFNNGQPEKFEDFLTGFLIENGEAQFARLAGLCVYKDGSLLISDDENGIIYRVSY